MSLFTDEELEQLPEFNELELALRRPEKVFRFEACRIEDAAQVEWIAELRHLQSLSISLSDVSRLLPRLGDLTDLQRVYLQACKIPVFPNSLLGLPNLRFLVIGNSSLNEVPEGIGSLASLEHLGLSQNSLREIPEAMGTLKRLKTLSLSYNEIRHLPEALGEMQALECLYLDVNKLREFPEPLVNLPSLKSLCLRSNQLTDLPESFCSMASLRSLNLENNPWVSLPQGLSRMENLEVTIEASKRPMYMDWSYKHSEKTPQVDLEDMRLFVAPGSPLFEPFLASVREGELGPYSDMLVKTGRETLFIESTVPDDYSQTGSSRLGGFPDLSDAVMFPKTDGLHWMFLAQLNLADVAPFNSYLPRSGLLSFFLDDTESRNGKVIFHSGGFEELKTIRHGGPEEMTTPDEDHTQSPHRMKFRRAISSPQSPPDEMPDEPTRELYEKWDSANVRSDHHINGYTYTQHESPQDQAASHLRGQTDEWVPLLSLGWDGQVGFCFWDAGTVTFCIHQEDLRRGDFSNVHVSLESS